MANDAKKLAGVALVVLRLTRGRLGVGGVIALIVAAVLYTAVIQPLAEKSFGVSLPTIGGPSSRDTAQDRPSEAPQGRPAAFDPAELGDLLIDRGRGVYESPAGVRYTRGSKHGHRLKHLLSHATDDPNRPGQHGVFGTQDPAELVRLVDEAYEQALSERNTVLKREDGRRVFTVNLGRQVGYVGGQSGSRRGKPAARHMRLVMQDDRLITAFPVIP